MFKDVIRLLYQPKLNIAWQSHMLRTLQHFKQSIFVLFLEVEDQEVGWSEREEFIATVVKCVFNDDQDREHLLMCIECTENGWVPHAYEMRQKWNVTVIPTLIRFDLVELEGMNYLIRRLLVGDECVDVHKLAAIRDDETCEIVPGPCKRHMAALIPNEKGNFSDGWEWRYVGSPDEEEDEAEQEKGENEGGTAMEEGEDSLERKIANVRDTEGFFLPEIERATTAEGYDTKHNRKLLRIVGKPLKVLKALTHRKKYGEKNGGLFRSKSAQPAQTAARSHKVDQALLRRIETLFGYVSGPDPNFEILPEGYVPRKRNRNQGRKKRA
ncbi:hypothetical protein H072_6619 [Dactylellina haptotyla CBS 200.50]|uniref:Uncharacterized protein n=1 Tax=Dactylellina haptotyla (strain CBS 200.50) TaxID=1284197 RepID=S8AEM7_DACHA|nr:hypothetical protein H072_6619 [Dactylellina haptotyla CBS 200.50]